MILRHYEISLQKNFLKLSFTIYAWTLAANES